MKKLFLIFITISFFAIGNSLFAQEEQPIASAEDSTYLKCLYETNNFVSVNLLQFVVGTANVNYELFISDRYSIKVGGGTVLGYRILIDDYENCIPGGYYYTIEPRWYTFQSTKNCWMQMGVSAAYKYWNYTRNDIVDDPNAKPGDPITYKKTPKNESVGQISLFGKHPVTGGFSFEYQVGVGGGARNSKAYITPNVGFSIGFIF